MADAQSSVCKGVAGIRHSAKESLLAWLNLHVIDGRYVYRSKSNDPEGDNATGNWEVVIDRAACTVFSVHCEGVSDPGGQPCQPCKLLWTHKQGRSVFYNHVMYALRDGVDIVNLYATREEVMRGNKLAKLQDVKRSQRARDKAKGGDVVNIDTQLEGAIANLRKVWVSLPQVKRDRLADQLRFNCAMRAGRVSSAVGGGGKLLVGLLHAVRLVMVVESFCIGWMQTCMPCQHIV